MVCSVLAGELVFCGQGLARYRVSILVWIVARTLESVTTWDYRKRVGIAFAFAVLFALSDEWHQTFVPGRDGCVRDVGIDVVGAALAAGTLLARRRRRV